MATEQDWTMDPATGASNASVAFTNNAEAVERIILDSGADFLYGKVHLVARRIMSLLAHMNGLTPKSMLEEAAYWTMDRETQCENSSVAFMALVEEVERLILDSSRDLLLGRANAVGRLIVAKLAHEHDIVPNLNR